jgi:hypothetical protein
MLARLLASVAAVFALVGHADARLLATERQRFTAIALPATVGSPTPIDILVERWSTPAENDQVMAALKGRGNQGVLETLQKLPRVGSFATTGATGYPLRYARQTVAADGVERITLATDRPIGFWEAFGRARTLDYPITLIELRLKPNGEGEGHAAPAARISLEPVTKTIFVENFEFQPVQLKSVKRQR